MSKTPVAYVREYLHSIGVQVRQKEPALSVSRKLSQVIGCNPPVSLQDANRLIDQFAVGKKFHDVSNTKRRPADWFKPLKRKPYEYKSTRHIPSLVADVRVWWYPV